jgi:hypothetical protein
MLSIVEIKEFDSLWGKKNKNIKKKEEKESIALQQRNVQVADTFKRRDVYVKGRRFSVKIGWQKRSERK